MGVRTVIEFVLPYSAGKWLRAHASVDNLPFGNRFDKIYHKRKFMHFYGRWPAQNSMLLSDYLYRLKVGPELVDPLRVRVTDKQFVKDYVREIVGDEYNVPTIAVLESFQEVLEYDFPQDCVIKPTHSSQQVMYRRDGGEVKFDQIRPWFDGNLYRDGLRERNYKSLTPKVIVEPFLFGSNELYDFKIYCVNGEPKLLQVDGDRARGHTRACFDVDWNLLPLEINFPVPKKPSKRPTCLTKMLDVARKMSAQFSFIRVDLYVEGDDIRVGELTNLPEAGNVLIRPEKANELVSNMLFGTA